MGLRDQLFAEGPRCSPRPAGATRSSRRRWSARGVVGRDLGLRHLRRLRPRVPRRDRARRPHRRPAPAPRDGRIEFPRRGRDDAARSRAAANPWGKAQTERADWAEGLDVRILSRVSRTRGPLLGRLRRLLRRARTRDRPVDREAAAAAGVDFAILGPSECCTGDPARRAGNEYTYQSYAQQNIETLNATGVTRIVARCPHCYNTLSNEYPDFGGLYEVVHHTELLAELVERRAARAGRRHGGDHLPRLVLPGPPQRRARRPARAGLARSGGRSRWPQWQARLLLRRRRRAHVDGGAGSAINEERAREAVGTGASTLAVACPFCTVMLDDGVRQVGGDMRVADVATLACRGARATSRNGEQE